MSKAQELRIRALEPRIAGFFMDQSARITARYLSSKPIEIKAEADTIFDYSEEDLALARAILEQLGVSASLASEIAAGFIDDGSPTEPERIAILIQRAGTRIRGINSYTLSQVRNTIQQGMQAGYTHYQIAEGVPADKYRGLRAMVLETYQNRAQAIARTETGTIMNQAAVDRYDRGGMQLVEVMDGPECGWMSHDDPDLANGSIRTVAEAAAFSLSHPNCRRVFLPYNPAWIGAGDRIVPVPEIVHYGE